MTASLYNSDSFICLYLNELELLVFVTDFASHTQVRKQNENKHEIRARK